MIPNIYIYRPYLFINCYGSAILLGIFIFIALISKDKRFTGLIDNEKFYNVVSLSVLVGIIGARLFWIIDEWQDIDNWYEVFMLWRPGYYLLGSIIAIILIVPVYLKKINVSILPFLDLVAIYAPLLQAVSRIGCFLAGCCYGTPTDLPWGVIYTNNDCLIAENLKHVSVHPTQLYSSLLLLIIFCLIYFVIQHRVKLKGQIFTIYFMLMLLERFFHDFLRADREFFSIDFLSWLSINQWVAFFMLIVTSLFVVYLYFSVNKIKKVDYESF